MKKLFSQTVVFSVLASFIFTFAAQPLLAAPAAYIRMDNGFFDSPEVVVDGKVYEQKFMGNYDLAEAMKSNPKALQYAEMNKSKASTAAWIFVGSFVGGLALMFSTNKLDGAYFAGFGIFIAGMFTSAYFLKLAQANLYNAVNTYNGVDVSASSKLKSFFEDLRVGVEPIKEGAVATFKFPLE